MTNKTMALADALTYTRLFVQEGLSTTEEVDAARAALATEVKAQQGYTRAVISERDAYKTSLKATKGEVYRLLSERDVYQVEADKLAMENKKLRDHIHTCGPTCSKAGCVNSRLRKVAQQALEALSDIYAHSHTNLHMKQIIEALRKELGHG